MDLYCGPCDDLNERKKQCEKFKQKLTYSKYSGAIQYTAFEKCDECKNLKNERMDFFEGAGESRNCVSEQI